MKTANLTKTGIEFSSDADFAEAIKVGFFRIKTPADLDLKVAREFAKKFTSDHRYTQIGEIDTVNGYLQSEFNQTKRFTLERDLWNAPHFKDGQSNYPKEIQEIGHKLHNIGVQVLKSILKRFELTEELWFEATGGSSRGEGSHFLLFNCYDPKDSHKPDGVAEHRDWSHITVLDATEPGLEAKIDGVYLLYFLYNALECVLKG